MLLAPGRFRFLCEAVQFDGFTYLTRGALNGAVDHASGIFASYFRFESAFTHHQPLLMGGTEVGNHTVEISILTDVPRFRVQCYDTSFNAAVAYQTFNPLPTGTWVRVLASWTSGARHLYVNDVSDNDLNSANGNACDYTAPSWVVGASFDGAAPLVGAIAQLYWAPGQYLDFSVEANRHKFYKPDGTPVYLGADGSLPTGVAPLMYHHLDDGESAPNFATNRGTGGGFGINGELTICSTSPSDV